MDFPETNAEQPFAAVNVITGVITQRFDTAEELADHVFGSHDVPEVGVIQFYGLGVRPFYIVEETEEDIRVAPIEFEFTKNEDPTSDEDCH